VISNYLGPCLDLFAHRFQHLTHFNAVAKITPHIHGRLGQLRQTMIFLEALRATYIYIYIDKVLPHNGYIYIDSIYIIEQTPGLQLLFLVVDTKDTTHSWAFYVDVRNFRRK
jgi:hypothetical protein